MDDTGTYVPTSESTEPALGYEWRSLQYQESHTTANKPRDAAIISMR